MPEGQLCNACEIERIGCPCDGSLDGGCFLCTPEKHARPDCPPGCPNHGSISPERIARAAEGKVMMSGSAVASVQAALSAPRGRSDQEKAFDEMIKAVVIKDGHRQAVPTQPSMRLYAVTTIASSQRYGGVRTPVVCTSFERAKEIIEKNVGDIFECSYMLALIEGIYADHLYGNILDEQYWYVWKGNAETGAYVPIECPKGYENTIGIGGIG